MKHLLVLLTWLLLLIPYLSANSQGAAYLEQFHETDATAYTQSRVATQFQSIVEVLKSAQSNSLTLDSVFLNEALAYLNSMDANNTEILCSQLAVKTLYGIDPTNTLQALLKNANIDGGFGELPGFDSTVLDTALSLEVLYNTAETTVSRNAISFLINRQHTDGSWGERDQTGSIYTTALALRALWLYRNQYNLSTQLEKAKLYLESKQSNNLWGELHQSARVLIALAPMYDSIERIQGSIDTITLLQQSDGSWEHDPYTTALLLQAISFTASPVPNPDLGSIKGIVVDAQTLAPLQNVAISITSSTSHNTVTDDNGKFSIDALELGSYQLQITFQDYQSVSATFMLSQGETADFGIIKISPVEAGATTSIIKGVVTDSVTSRPISGALIEIGSIQTYSLEDGSYQINGITPGTYAVTVTAEGYQPASTSATLGVGALAIFSPKLQIKSALPVSGNLTTLFGTVSDATTNAILANVTLTLEGVNNATVQSDTTGQYRFNELNAGATTMFISVDGYHSYETTFDVIANANMQFNINLYPISTTPPSTYPTPAANPSIFGFITDAVNGDILEGVDINITGSSVVHTMSDASGYYRIEPLNIGSIEVLVSKEGYKSAYIEVDVNESLQINFSASLDRVGATVIGTIFDGDTGAALEGVEIALNGNVAGISDSNGSYDMAITTYGKQEMSFQKSGYQSLVFEVYLSESSFVNLSPKMYVNASTPPLEENTASLEGVIVNSRTNEPIADADIQVDYNGFTEHMTSNAEGKFSLSGITTADVNITVTKEEFVGSNLLIVLNPTEHLNIGQIRLRPEEALVMLPDLKVANIDVNNTATNPQTLELNGTITVTFVNIGNVAVETPITFTAFYDSNNDGNYTLDDIWLGEHTYTDTLGVDETSSTVIAVSAIAPFRDAPISVMIDSGLNVIELDETNNILSSSSNCRNQPIAIGNLNPVVKWHWDGTAPSTSYRQVMSTPIVGRLYDDNNDSEINQKDTPYILFTSFSGGSYNGYGVLHIVRGDDGSEVKNISGVTAANAPAIADIDNDGKIDIVVGKGSHNGLMAYNSDGSLKWENTTGSGNGEPAIADLNNDGTPEILYIDGVFSNIGERLWSFRASGIPIVLNLDDDAALEVISGNTAYDTNGSILWSTSLAGNYAIGNFNDDTYPELVRIGNAQVSLLSHDGNLIWGPVAIPGGGGAAPIVADMDGDGKPEIGIAGRYYYVVFEDDGSIKWLISTQDYSSASTGSTVFDFEGDGKAEILYADEHTFRIYEGSTGKVLYSLPNPSGTIWEYPVVADVDNDGSAEIVIAANDYAWGSYHGIRVLEDANDTWMPTRAIWNQHSYHINNINDDGTVPQYETPSWLTHNTYRLNTFLDRDPLATPDLSLSLLHLHDNINNYTLSVRVGNGGAITASETQVHFFTGDPSNGGVLLGTVNVEALENNTYSDVTLEGIENIDQNTIVAIVDYDGKINECNEANNRLEISNNASNVLGTISVATDKPFYGAYEDINLSTLITNPGQQNYELSAKLRIVDANNSEVTAFDLLNPGILSAGSTYNAIQPYNSGILMAGTYFLVGTLYDNEGQIIDSDTATFNIVSSSASGSLAMLRVETDHPIYHTNDSVELEHLIQNLSTNTVLTGTYVELNVTHSSSSVTALSTILPVAEMTPQGSRNFIEPLQLKNAPVGTYDVQAYLYTVDGTLLDSAATTFEVAAEISKSLIGEVNVAYASIEQGEPQQCNDLLYNFSFSPLSNQPIRQLLIAIDTNSSVNQTDQMLSLDANASLTYMRDIETDSLAAGDYACVLQAQDNNEWVTLGYASFQITVPPIKVIPEIKPGAAKRLLILLDDKALCKKGDTYGPINAADLESQKAYLKALLDTYGFSYTIVTDDNAFECEFRSGMYGAYAIFSEQHILPVDLQTELREAVFRGEGLLISGSHDSRNHHLFEILGVDYRGKLIHIDTLTMENNTTLPLDLDDDKLKITLSGAESLGIFGKQTKKRCLVCSDTTYPAITRYDYHKGHTRFIAFDALLYAMQNSEAETLLLESLEAISDSSDTVTYPISTIGMDLTLNNQGIATAGMTKSQLFTSDVSFIETDNMQLNNEGSLEAPFDLKENETQTQRIWMALGEEAAGFDLESSIYIGETPDLMLHDTLRRYIEVTPLPTLETVLTQLEHRSIEYKYVEKAISYASRNKWNMALHYARLAADRLTNDKTQESVRETLAFAIKAIAYQYSEDTCKERNKLCK